ncbi:hypothetical protein H6P81_009190 [Aristolochia fimbriata]|uniref:aminodeoxychorismate synthase n=1 Tax=Aristolochia fimbriata TaxID=158543 RepID=A0AAV7EK44_ARIFI|nr:hypothetical protein H6P81_009190 [Aristolochia fimbriata]
MKMKLVLSSSTHENPCLHSWKSLQQAVDKPLVCKPSRKFVYVNDLGQHQPPKSNVGRVRISRSVMPGPVQEFYKGDKYRQEEASSRLRTVRTLLIDNYDSYTYNIYQELSTINGAPPTVIHNDEWTWEHFYYCLYEEKAFDNIVISPGPGSPTCPTDIGLCLRILLECKDIPILGVCLGHQALGYAHGANIIHAPMPVHGRLSEIQHNGCNLFDGIPSGCQSGFKVVRYHSLIIDAQSLPEELIPIAWTSSMDNHSSFAALKSDMVLGHDVYQCSVGNSSINEQCLKPKYPKKDGESSVLMGIMHSTRPHFGVQFHPESVATCYGRKIFENFKEITIDYLRKSSHFHDRKVHNWAWMQVSHSSQLLEKLQSSASSKPQPTYPVVGPVVNSSLRIVQMNKNYLKLQWKKIDNLENRVGGSRNIFCKLFGGQKAIDTFWLDSSSTDQKRARFSFMGGKGGSLWRQITFRLSSESDVSSTGGYLSIEDAQGSVRSMFLEDGFLDFLNKELQSFHYSKEDYKGLPFDFCGGYVGFIGYDLKVECGATCNHHKSGTPDACFFFVDNLVVVDHSNGDVYLLSLENNCYPNEALSAETMNGLPWLDKIEKQLLELMATDIKKYTRPYSNSAIGTRSEEGFVTQKSRNRYVKDVEKCLKFIKDGESYELCLTTQMRKRTHDTDLLALYLNLRNRNPAPYAAWLSFAKESLCICCSSPERFLRLDGNEILEAKPIKGTIARGVTKEEDERLRLQLMHSVKDQAENLMIVDLLRNDLGRVCEPGSVHVPRLMDVESYATVHTMVSTIQGKKKLNLSPIDCVRAAFPGGSMTGAPKLRSMELLDSLEDCSRGVYSGSIGFFSYNQTFDLNIVIRTIVIHKGVASIGAGGAIIALSNPVDEFEEMKLKARAPAKAFMEVQGQSEKRLFSHCNRLVSLKFCSLGVVKLGTCGGFLG